MTAAPATRAPVPREEPLRVCLLHNYREGAQMSMKLYAERLGDALVDQGVQVQRVRVPDLLPPSLRRHSWLSKLDSYAGRFVAYPLTARRQRADVYHIIDHGQAYLLDHLDASRTVVTCHDVILLALAAGRMVGGKAPVVATRVLRYAVGHLPRARVVIADSEHTRRDLMSLVGLDPDKIEIVAPGLNGRFRVDPELGAQARERWHLGDGPLVMHVGQAGFYKNMPGCLRVMAKVRQGGIDATFLRAGQPLRPEQLALAQELGVADAMREIGPVTEEELIALYNAADVLLFPSIYEGFGWPPLEAMACGTPVVCTRAGSLREVVGDAASTTTPDDIDGLAERVAAVLTDATVAADLTRRGLAHAALFDWQRAAAQVREIYARVAGGV